MTHYTLTPRSALGGLEHDIGGVRVSEVSNRAIASLAIATGGIAALRDAISRHYDAQLPAVGQSSTSSVANTRLLGLARDQFFLLVDDTGPGSVSEVAEQLQGAAYLTDQSDSWVMIRVSGPSSRAALERVCMLDLHPDVFVTGAAARTVMEHLGTIIVNEGDNSYLLMSARSSANSFWHMIKTSVAGLL